MKIPPRTVFSCQAVATVWAAIVQVAVLNWALGTITDVCTPYVYPVEFNPARYLLSLYKGLNRPILFAQTGRHSFPIASLGVSGNDLANGCKIEPTDYFPGAIGPDRMLGPKSMYHDFQWFWLVGAALPVLFYFLGRMFPKSPVRHLNAPV